MRLKWEWTNQTKTNKQHQKRRRPRSLSITPIVSLFFSLSRSSSPPHCNFFRSAFQLKFYAERVHFYSSSSILKVFDLYSFLKEKRNGEVKYSKLIVEGIKDAIKGYPIINLNLTDALDILLHVFQPDLHSSRCLFPCHSVNFHPFQALLIRSGSLLLL
ncbi:unnamed protein product [Brassica rapa]|uniref:Uncharacterized protein n=1 Tax=Brassica campestris TaxID=3711 RepID=A0A8D9HLM3_BRACM|nr:unnamed protein product [Brassica rapa]